MVVVFELLLKDETFTVFFSCGITMMTTDNVKKSQITACFH